MTTISIEELIKLAEHTRNAFNHITIARNILESLAHDYTEFNRTLGSYDLIHAAIERETNALWFMLKELEKDGYIETDWPDPRQNGKQNDPGNQP